MIMMFIKKVLLFALIIFITGYISGSISLNWALLSSLLIFSGIIVTFIRIVGTKFDNEIYDSNLLVAINAFVYMILMNIIVIEISSVGLSSTLKTLIIPIVLIVLSTFLVKVFKKYILETFISFTIGFIIYKFKILFDFTRFLSGEYLIGPLYLVLIFGFITIILVVSICIRKLVFKVITRSN